MDNKRNVFGLVGLTENAALLALKTSGVKDIIIIKNGNPSVISNTINLNRINIFIEENNLEKFLFDNFNI